jgi:choline-sulfatase
MIGTDLRRIADAPEDKGRVIFSEYHAVGAVTGAFMIRKGNWKLIHYVNFEPELFNLDADPEELTNQAGNPVYADKLAELTAELHNICDPEAVDARAHADQRAMVDALGGLEAARHLGPKGATPPPEVT